jgi:hypothetical protein
MCRKTCFEVADSSHRSRKEPSGPGALIKLLEVGESSSHVDDSVLVREAGETGSVGFHELAHAEGVDFYAGSGSSVLSDPVEERDRVEVVTHAAAVPVEVEQNGHDCEADSVGEVHVRGESVEVRADSEPQTGGQTLQTS